MARFARVALALCAIFSSATANTSRANQASSSCAVEASERVDCGYVGIQADECTSKGCCWDPADDDAGTTPWCFTSLTSTSGYTLAEYDLTSSGMTGTLLFQGSSLTSDIQALDLTISFLSDDTARVRITDANATRWEIPDTLVPDSLSAEKARKSDAAYAYSLSFTETPFSFALTRDADGAILFNSSTALTFQDQYIELTTSLPSENALFGVGESTRTKGLQIPAGTTSTLWARDNAAAIFDTNLYGSHPVYFSLAPTGEAFGAFMRNSNGMDVVYANDSSSLTFKMIGGVIDLYVFSGSAPADVAAQYTELVGRPTLMPYWSLGFHQCKYGYTTIYEAEDVWTNYTAAKIPLDTMWLDIDYMEYWKDWTLDPKNFPSSEVSSFVSELHDNGQHFVVIVDPGILAVDPSWNMTYDPYTTGMEQNLFVKDGFTGEPYMSQVWPGPTYMPDWFHPNVSSYWTDSIKTFHDEVEFDGLWTDMNEVANFCNDGTGQVCSNTDPDNCPTLDLDSQTTCCLSCKTIDSSNVYDFPPYAINNDNAKDDLGVKTMPMSAVHFDGENTLLEYDVHNLFGLTEARLTAEALDTVRDGKRPFVLSRSTFPSHGTHAAHWTGDNAATWEDLSASTVTVINFAFFGIPMLGSDICGFIGTTTEELCARWIEVGAFHPFSRNHNAIGEAPQELYRWPLVAQASRNALGLRYSLLPYLYALMFDAKMTGALVARPLWSNFPTDATTHTIDTQFMLGSALMMSPVLTEGATSVDAYFPSGTWYALFDCLNEYDDAADDAAAVERDVKARRITAPAKGSTVTLDTPLTATNVHVLGGSVLPMHSAGAMTTTEALASPYRLLVALSSTGSATGVFFADDGGDVKNGSDDYTLMSYNVASSALSSSVSTDEYDGAASLPLTQIVILGTDKPTAVKLTIGKSTDSVSWDYDADRTRLTVDLSSETVMMNTEFTLEWN